MRVTLNPLSRPGVPAALVAWVILTAPVAPALADGPGARLPQALPRIAYYSFRSGNAEIYLMDPDGSNQIRLTSHGAADLSPAISPGGAEIAFSRASGNGCTLHVMSAGGTGERQLTTGPWCDAIPDWSPDGLTLLFHSDRDGRYEIYVMDAQGADQRRLTNGPGDKVGPKWSPDGTRIVYALADFSLNRASIHIMNADGSADTALTDGSWNDEAPDWSVGGDRIVFNSNRSTANEIYSIDLGGGDLRRLTWDQGDSRGPNWGAVPDPSDVEGPAGDESARPLRLEFPKRTTPAGRCRVPSTTAVS